MHWAYLFRATFLMRRSVAACWTDASISAARRADLRRALERALSRAAFLPIVDAGYTVACIPSPEMWDSISRGVCEPVCFNSDILLMRVQSVYQIDGRSHHSRLDRKVVFVLKLSSEYQGGALLCLTPQCTEVDIEWVRFNGRETGSPCGVYCPRAGLHVDVD